MTAPSVLALDDWERFAEPRRTLAIAAVLAAMVLVVLGAAIANIALPTIERALHVTPAAAVRVVTAYQLGLVISLLPAAALGESLGYRRVFLTGAAIFTLASIICALSPSLNILVAARFVQGLGGAAIMSLGIALLRFIVPKDRLSAAIGWNALTVALTSAAGPMLGAAILSVAPWPWLFVVNLPIGLMVLLAACSLPRVRGTGQPVDFLSVALSACFFALIVIGVQIAPNCPVLAGALVVGAAAIAVLLVKRESRYASPLIPLDLLRTPSLGISVIASVMCFTGVSAALVALPFHFQNAHGMSPVITGLYLTPWPLAVASMAPVVGRLANRISPAWLCFAGGVLLSVGLGLAAILPVYFGPLTLSFCTILCGIGFGFFNVPNNRNIFLSAPRERSSAAGGLQSLARLSGQTAGGLLMTVLFTLVPVDTAPRLGLSIGAVMSLSAGVVMFLWSGALRTVSKQIIDDRGAAIDP